MELLEGMTFDSDMYKDDLQEAASVFGVVLTAEELEEMAQQEAAKH